MDKRKGETEDFYKVYGDGTEILLRLLKFIMQFRKINFRDYI